MNRFELASFGELVQNPISVSGPGLSCIVFPVLHVALLRAHEQAVCPGETRLLPTSDAAGLA